MTEPPAPGKTPASGKTPPRGRVLVVEDEEYVRASLGEVLRARGFDVDLVESVTEALALLERSPIDIVLTDLKMPRDSGQALVIKVRDLYPGLPIVVLTGQGTIPSAVACIKAGARDYLLKPVDPDTLEVALDRALEASALRREVDYLRRGDEEDARDDSLPVGTSAAWNEVMRRVNAAAPSDATVLILGESGTGKEIVARLIHRLSRRAEGPYVRVNCAAIPLEMWESEFFGHRRGAFTGAGADHDGRFRLAHRGTLFMDEIGAMPSAAQAKILRVLQDGEFDRLGDTQPTRVDVRIIAATNSNLPAEAAAGRFRQDLFYRLNVIRLDLPPLRDRPADIPPLAKRFVRQFAARLGRPAPEIGPAELADFAAYSWPGNVRELQNVIERALILNPGPSLGPLDLPAPDVAAPSAAAQMSAGGPGGSPPAAAGASTDLNLRTALGGREKELVEEALRRSGGVRKEAARLLGIDQRNLGYYLRKHGIDPDKTS